MARTVSYAMTVSLDGYVTDPDGGIGWTVPDEELHRFHNARARELDTHLLGRRLYEVMRYWDAVAEDPSAGGIEREFAGIWRGLERLVFSSTLDRVEGGATLVRGGLVAEVTRLKEQPGRGIGVGGAGLAATLIEHDLIDQYEMFVAPVILGGGTPFLPPGVRRDLRLAETRRFDGAGRGVTYLRYVRYPAGPPPGARIPGLSHKVRAERGFP